MVMFFTEEDLVSFGNYMVSSLREERIRESVMFTVGETVTEEQIQNRLQAVSDADIHNWAQEQTKTPA